MTPMVNYVHIGYPKNFSTSLQRDYFSKHPDIFHLGIGLDSNLGYFDTTVDKTFEVYLKTAKVYSYEQKREELINHFEALRAKAESQGAKAFGASSEHLSFCFTYDGLSGDIKANRVLELFGSDTKIIMIIRNQMDLVKSLYRESVRVGFKGSFADYIYYLFKYQDRNYVSDLYYDWVYQLYVQRFGKENVHVLFFEDYRKEGELVTNAAGMPVLFDRLNEVLGLPAAEMQLGHYNIALSDGAVNQKAELNRSADHDLGNHLYDSAEKHRIKHYLEEDLGLTEQEEKTYEDVITKRRLIEEAKKRPGEATISYQCDSTMLNKLVDSFSISNTNFERITGLSLPSGYHK